MQTQLEKSIRDTAVGQEAEAILRSCVHCGFCTATCPTYQLIGDELDGPRGRIYLIKQMLEGAKITRKTQRHLDRCLTCRSCETTCPSGVQYGRLIDIGRGLVEERVGRSWFQQGLRFLLRSFIPFPTRLRTALYFLKPFRFLIPQTLNQKIPSIEKTMSWPQGAHKRKMLVLEGCVQSVATPVTNFELAQILDRLGIQLMTASKAGCCGGMSYHLGQHKEGEDFMRRNIDAWWPYVEDGIEALIVSASGCAVTVKEYGDLLAQDSEYADKAKRISELARDVSEVISKENLESLGQPGKGKQIAFHSPCTLQHGQSINGVVEIILQNLGYELTEVMDAHLCCGSAGTYSILQPAISKQLLGNKINSLGAGGPEIIATANIGCQMHLASGTEIPVVHWLELIH